MREILFRGKRIDSGEWIEGCNAVSPTDSKSYIYAKDYTEVDIAEDGLHVAYRLMQVLPETVGQYTGLTDKNGKKIFEGDILAAPDYPNLKYKVSFLNANFCVKCPAQPYLFYLGSRCFDMFGNPEYEIVGNIHDNPELLEVEE